MSIALVTGSAGLIGSESVYYFTDLGMDVIGIDNDMRGEFFGEEGSTEWNRQRLVENVEDYAHEDIDIRNQEAVNEVFSRYGSRIEVIIHTAAQPSHDWAAREPMTDFTVNANGTLVLLEAAREHCPTTPFIFTSTNKVYGDRPNTLPLVEKETRWEIDEEHRYADGIAEDMSIDQSMHSLFGSSKVAADILVQEYGRYFDLPTACFRGGCLTGPSHSGTQLHGFLSYLMKCAATGEHYTIFGHKGKQVRDNIHSEDLVAAFHAFYESPRVGEVYNIGGGRQSHCSMLEAIRMCEDITGHEMNYSLDDEHRPGDHIWYISDLSKFKSHYADWDITYDVREILEEIYNYNADRWENHK
ncbi:CDP-paratose 2-epimerase [Salinibacter ruber]|jgi:CDP-paratose 2-epimerase|uniref:NAD-dependent epimerase/dehydratase family protein n=1 Tax=Salinibacter ruber TaxID=146919 RepID=UPI002169B6A8|nr:NAD-dependent epimerase/dehydratase family protein [Salinibacter ruber]MCS3650591.1 CDP-paratose 2-epimerase [Salinibacter ruber]MCS3653843.1 CDP-paratose 2-epimerase [Salinibacter ruber]